MENTKGTNTKLQKALRLASLLIEKGTWDTETALQLLKALDSLTEEDLDIQLALHDRS